MSSFAVLKEMADQAAFPVVRVAKGFAEEMPLVLTAFAVMLAITALVTYRQNQLEQRATNDGTKRNLWKLYGKFYDLTPFLNIHPGGPNILMSCVNTDATAFMESYHVVKNNDLIKHVMKKFEVPIETLSPEQMEPIQKRVDFPDPMSSPFYSELNRRVRILLDADKPRHLRGHTKATPIVFAYYWALFFTFVLLYPSFAYDGSIAAPLIMGTLIFALGIGTLHDGTHRSLSETRWINDFYAIAFGSSHDTSYCWYHTHVFNHHVNTNIEDCDADAHLALGVGHFFNKKNMSPWMVETLAHVGVFFKACGGLMVYYMASFIFTLSDNPQYRIPYPFSQQYIRVRDLVYQHQLSVYWWVEALARFVWIYALAVHPMLVAPTWGVGARSVFLYHASWSFQHYITTMCVHDNSKCDTVEPYIPGADWAKWQITHSVDFNPYSTICNFWSTGCSNQVCHHLYPGVHWVNYPAISKLIAEICEEENVQYHAFESTWGMWVGHVKEVIARQPPFNDDCKRPSCYGYLPEGGEDKVKKALKLKELGVEDKQLRSTWLNNADWEYEQEALHLKKAKAA